MTPHHKRGGPARNYFIVCGPSGVSNPDVQIPKLYQELENLVINWLMLLNQVISKPSNPSTNMPGVIELHHEDRKKSQKYADGRYILQLEHNRLNHQRAYINSSQSRKIISFIIIILKISFSESLLLLCRMKSSYFTFYFLTKITWVSICPCLVV